ncbi:hypothetical protein EHS25_006690 [Saitozyma podzolica]|uniref:Asl1-like glycosyl hydrolase catalytic domain-containing protein n=1 Tax=Saitozyma podzolica TaxID=1890683 RepID=A0A427YSN0_9TREE|nr:hypothetical protein EHS25_006690 [Saitozyma podzolica]
MAKLLQLLPTLALVTLALSGLEQVPSALAHKPIARGPRDHHRHIAAREKLAAGVGAQERKRGLIRRSSDGTTCRVRGDSSSSSSSVAAAPASTYSAPASSAPAYSAPASSSSPDYANNYASPSSAASSAAPAAQSSAAASSSSSSGGSGSTGGWTNSGSKFGLGWPNGNYASSGSSDYIGNYIGSKSAWYYTWSPFNVGSGDSLGLEFVPMLWGPNQVGDWWGQQSSWPSTVKNALFFNEPNEASQSNVAASDAIQYWMNDMVPLRTSKGVSLGGAATTSAPDGLTWIQSFQSLCTQYGNSAADCAMDFVPIHWYDTTPSNFQSYIENFHQQTGLDIWVTEYACQNFNGGAQCSDSDTWYLHQQMAPWFDSQDYIKRYSPFGVMENLQGVNQDNALMNPDGSITSLGSWYIYSA